MMTMHYVWHWGGNQLPAFKLIISSLLHACSTPCWSEWSWPPLPLVELGSSCLISSLGLPFSIHTPSSTFPECKTSSSPISALEHRQAGQACGETIKWDCSIFLAIACVASSPCSPLHQCCKRKIREKHGKVVSRNWKAGSGVTLHGDKPEVIVDKHIIIIIWLWLAGLTETMKIPCRQLNIWSMHPSTYSGNFLARFNQPGKIGGAIVLITIPLPSVVCTCWWYNTPSAAE